VDNKFSTVTYKNPWLRNQPIGWLPCTKNSGENNEHASISGKGSSP